MLNNQNLTACDKEPIHISGTIQPHGILLALDETTLEIKQASINTLEQLQIPHEVILNKPLDNFITKQALAYLRSQLDSKLPLKDLSSIVWVLNNKHFEVSMHRSGGLLIIELEPVDTALTETMRYQLYRQTHHSIEKIHHVDDLHNLFQQAVELFQQLTGFDRVMLYQFMKDDHGQVMAEIKPPELETFLNLHYPASDIPKQARALYIKNSIRIISNVNAEPVPIEPNNNPLLNEPLDLSYATLRSVSPVHIQYLKNMGVGASMSISIIIENKLWGLIACHHRGIKYLNSTLRNCCQLFGKALAWQIADLRTKTILKNYENHRHQAASLYNILSGHEKWPNELKRYEKEFLSLVNAVGATICHQGQYLLFGMTPDIAMIRKIAAFIIKQPPENLYITDSISQSFAAASECKTTASGIIAIVLEPTEGDIIMWFRPGIVQTVNWAGNPNKAVTNINEQLTPRVSFALWQEQVSGQSLPWEKSEILIAEEFKRFLMEVKFKHYYRKAQEESHKRLSFVEQTRINQNAFIDKICHEIRNPINGILGSLELLNDLLRRIEEKNSDVSITKDLEEAHSHLKSINACTQHQAVITNDVLTLSKYEQGKIEADKINFDLIATIKDSALMYQSQIKNKGLQFHLKLPEETILVKGDAKGLKQVLVNLMSNTVKFTEKGTIILALECLKTDSIASCFEISIIDTGMGMTPLEQERLFKPYMQANAKVASTYGGSGLGLYISQKIIENMNGNLIITSEKNVGTTVKFSFICEQLTENEKQVFEKKPISLPPNQSINHSTADKYILIVDDNDINRRVLTGLIKKLGYGNVDTAENGNQCLEKLFNTDKNKQYVIIFLDIEMPGIDGYETATIIRKKERELGLKPIQIICSTGNVREIYKARAEEVGMNSFLEKPLTKKAICTELEKVFATETEITESSRPTMKIV